MGIGWYQGGTRVPPDHPEGGGRWELYQQCLWLARKLDLPTSKFGPQKARQSHLKPPPSQLQANRKAAQHFFL